MTKLNIYPDSVPDCYANMIVEMFRHGQEFIRVLASIDPEAEFPAMGSDMEWASTKETVVFHYFNQYRLFRHMCREEPRRIRGLLSDMATSHPEPETNQAGAAALEHFGPLLFPSKGEMKSYLRDIVESIATRQ